MATATTKALALSTLIHGLAVGGLCATWSRPASTATMTISALYLFDDDGGPPSPLPHINAEPIREPIIAWPGIQPAGHVEPTAAPTPIESTSAPTASVHAPIPVSTDHRTRTKPTPGRVSFCGVATQAKSVVFVIDCSASMGLHGRLHRALTEVESSLTQLSVPTRFQVIAYHRSAEPLRIGTKPGLLVAEPETVTATVAALRQLRAEGSADHRRAINAALALRPDVIYFLTDEDDFTAAAAFDLTRANAGRCTIHTICLVAPTLIQSPLAQLASHNRGTFSVLEH